MITEEQMEALVLDEFSKRPARESFFNFLMRVAQKARSLAAEDEAARATPADHVSQARDAVIEECAKVCDEEAQRLLSLNLKMATLGALNCTGHIRALKSAPPEKPAGDVSDS